MEGPGGGQVDGSTQSPITAVRAAVFGEFLAAKAHRPWAAVAGLEMKGDVVKEHGSDPNGSPQKAERAQAQAARARSGG